MVQALERQAKRKVHAMREDTALRELQKGSEKALEWFIDTYSPYVTTIIHNIIGDRMSVSDVEEVAADVFYTLWKNAGNVHSVKGYLGTVARNMAINKCRGLGFELPLEDDILEVEQVGPESWAERKELRVAVRKSVLAMPQPDKEIFLRFYYYCQSLETIARETGVNLSTVKSKLRRGRLRLRDALAQYI